MSNKPKQDTAPAADEVKDVAAAPEADAPAAEGGEPEAEATGPIVEDNTDAPAAADEGGPYNRTPKVKKEETDGGAIIETYI